MAKGDPYCVKCGKDWKDCECDITEPDRPAQSAPTPSPSCNPRIPFGKYAGKKAAEVDDVRYLDWMLGIANDPFKSDLLKHLQHRQDWMQMENKEE